MTGAPSKVVEYWKESINVKTWALFLCVIVIAIGGYVNQAATEGHSQTFVKGLGGVRYQVKDVSRSLKFYTEQLGLKLDQQNLPAFAQVSVVISN